MFRLAWLKFCDALVTMLLTFNTIDFVGKKVGDMDGDVVGEPVSFVGAAVGMDVGAEVGEEVGVEVGVPVGAAVGAVVGLRSKIDVINTLSVVAPNACASAFLILTLIE